MLLLMLLLSLSEVVDVGQGVLYVSGVGSTAGPAQSRMTWILLVTRCLPVRMAVLLLAGGVMDPGVADGDGAVDVPVSS